MISATGGIDSSRIQAMIAQLKAAAATPAVTTPAVTTETPATTVEFSDALKSALDGVNDSMQQADALGDKFTKGDQSVSLSDVMISSQKAGIGFQATLQARNKLVSAYQSIMSMQV
jgi:flagellar hook-basal body complex protein FliE